MNTLTIYHADRQTGEFIGAGGADVDPEVPGNWLIPAHAYLDAPPEAKEGKAARRNAENSGWELVEDNRGTIYDTATGEPIELIALGAVPEGYTRRAPPGPFYRWSGTAWMLDSAAERAAQATAVDQTRDALLQEAALRIAPLQDAVDLDEATAEEITELKAWKLYRVSLNRLDQQSGYPASINWPVAPSER